MALKTSDLNAKLFAKTDKRKATNAQEAQNAARDKAQIIELVVAGENNVQFELQVVPADKVATQTFVFSENAREQAFLTEHALADILSTLKTKGQQYPAVGRLVADGRFEVLDGSRRRMSCILAQKEFLIYVAKDIDGHHAKFLSDVANAHKPLSLFERGKEMQLKLDAGIAHDQKSLAALFQCSEALVSGALKAASLPLELLQAYPNVSELGRPTIVKLHKLYNQLDTHHQQLLLDKCQNGQGFLWQRSEAQGLSRITKDVSETLELWIHNFNPSPTQSSPKVEVIKGRVSYVKSLNGFNLSLKKISEEEMADILQYIEEKIKK